MLNKGVDLLNNFFPVGHGHVEIRQNMAYVDFVSDKLLKKVNDFPSVLAEDAVVEESAVFKHALNLLHANLGVLSHDDFPEFRPD